MPYIIPDELKPPERVMPLSEALDVALGVLTEWINGMELEVGQTTQAFGKRLDELKAARDRLMKLQAMNKDVCEKLDI